LGDAAFVTRCGTAFQVGADRHLLDFVLALNLLQAAERLPRKLIRKQAAAPRVMITDKLGSYGAARRERG
jgi:transposase-like protein